MKKIVIIGFSLMAIACVKEKGLEPNKKEGKKISLTASHEATTRVALGEDDVTLNWEAGDALSVFDGSGANNKFDIANGAGSPSGIFEGTAGDAPYYAIYPYQSTASIDGNTITATFPQNQVLLEDTFDPQAAIMVAVSNDVSLSFYNAFAVLKFTLTGSSALNGIAIRSLGGEKLSGEVSVDATSTTPALTFGVSADDYLIADAASAIALNSTPKDLYVVVPAQDYTAGLEISFKTDEGVFIRRTKAMTIVRNSNTGTGTTNVIPAAYDLSTKGGSEPQETANSYVIESLDILLYGNLYRFPANVMGNGVWGSFADTEGDAFTLTNVGASDVQLLWQEAINTLTDVVLDNNYIEFKVGTRKGNAVIAATDGGDIKWSWHIWLPKTPIAEHQYDGTALPTILQDRNLGALSADAPSAKRESNDTFGLFYQWGRKDPFPRQTFAGTTAYVVSTTYNTSSVIPSLVTNQDNATASPTFQMMQTTSPYEWSKFSPVKDNSLVTASIDDAVKYPMWFFSAGANTPSLTMYNRYNWYKVGDPKCVATASYTIRNASLWDARTTPDDTENTKSAFDPCPRGWKVPYRNALQNSLVTQANALEASLADKVGLSFVINAQGETAWYPANGYIQYAPVATAANYMDPEAAIAMWSSYQFAAANNNYIGVMLRYKTSTPVWAFVNNSASGAVGIPASYGAQIRCMKSE